MGANWSPVSTVTVPWNCQKGPVVVDVVVDAESPLEVLRETCGLANIVEELA